MSVEITRFHLAHGSGLVKAYVDVEVGGVVVIHGVRLLEGRDGLWVAMPQTKSTKDHKWYDIVTVTSTDLKQEIAREVIARYEGGSTVVADGKREDTSEEAPF